MYDTVFIYNMKRVAIFTSENFMIFYLVRKFIEMGYIIKIIPVNCKYSFISELLTMGSVGQVYISDSYDIDNKNVLQKHLSDIDMVVNLVSSAHKCQGNFFAVNAKFPENLAKMARDIESIKSFVHFSTLGVDVHSDDKFARSKKNGEEAVLSSFSDAIIFRVGHIFGKEGDSFFGNLLTFAKEMPFFYPIVKGKTSLFPIYVGDVVDIVCGVLSDCEYEGGIFDIFGEVEWSMEDVWRLLLSVLGSSSKKCELSLSREAYGIISSFSSCYVSRMFRKLLIGDFRPLLSKEVVYLSSNEFNSDNDCTLLSKYCKNPKKIEDIFSVCTNKD